TGIEIERGTTSGRVTTTGCANGHRPHANRRVPLTGDVTIKRVITYGNASCAEGGGAPRRVAVERVRADSRVAGAGGIAKERLESDRRVVATAIIIDERVCSDGGVLRAGAVT